jgi:5-hydroxyisourate hydrolase-like protein (transthyretin family)
MSAINDYIKNLTKCCNKECNKKEACLRYSAIAKGKYKIKNNTCEYFFQSNAANMFSDNKEFNDLMNMFGMKK